MTGLVLSCWDCDEEMFFVFDACALELATGWDSGAIRFFIASRKKAEGLFFSFDSFDMRKLQP